MQIEHEIRVDVRAVTDAFAYIVQPHQLTEKLVDVHAHVEHAQLIAFVQFFVYQRHGGDTALALIEGMLQAFVGDRSGLQAQQAGHHLQIVLHPVVHLLDQHMDPFVGLFDLLFLLLQCLRLLRITDPGGLQVLLHAQ